MVRTQYFIFDATGSQGSAFGKFVLSPLQSRARIRAKIRSGVHVCPDRGCTAATEILGAADLLLPSVFSLAGHGPSAGRRPQLGRVADDSRHRQLRPRTHRGCMGGSARNFRLTAGYRNPWRPSSRELRRISGVLMRSTLQPHFHSSSPKLFNILSVPLWRALVLIRMIDRVTCL